MRKTLLTLFALSLAGLVWAQSSVWTHTSTEVAYAISSNQAALGPTAPTIETDNNHCVGLAFDADAEQVHLTFEIPSCWDGTQMTLKVYACPRHDDIPQNGETMKFDAAWRSILWGTDDTDHLTEDTATDTYTEGGTPGDAQDTIVFSLALVASNQDPQVGDVLHIHFDRDVGGDSYTGWIIVNHWEIVLNQDRLLCDHHN